MIADEQLLANGSKLCANGWDIRQWGLAKDVTLSPCPPTSGAPPLELNTFEASRLIDRYDSGHGASISTS